MSRSRVIASATMALVAFLAISLSLNVVHASQGALEPMLNPAAAAPHQAAEVEMSWASLIDTDASTVDFSDYNDRVFVEAQVTPKKAVAPKQPAGRVANGSAASKSVSDRLSPAEQQARWAEFKKANNKTYKTPAEEQAAFEQFKKNRATIVAHNDSNQFGKINPKPFKSSGPLADLSPEQFKARFNKLRKPGLDKIKAKNQPAKVHNQQQQEAQKRNAKQKNSVKGVASLFSKVKGLGSKVKGAVAPKGKAAAPAKKVAAHRFAELSAELEAGADMDLESLAEAATETEAEAESVLEAESGLDLSTEHEVEMEHWLDAEAEAEAESEVSQQWPNLFGSKAVPSSNRAGSAGGSASSAGGSASSAGGSASSAGGSASSAGGSASSAGGSASSAGGSASSAGGSASSAGGSASSLMSKPVCVDRPTSATKSLLELDADEAAFIEAEWDLFGKKPAVPSSNRAGSAGGSASSAGGSASSAGGSASSAGGSASSAGGSASSAGGSASSAGGSASSAGGSASSAGGSASSAGGSASLPFCDQLIVQPTDESMMVKFEPFTGSVLNNPADKTPNQRLCRVVAHTWMELHAKTAAARLIQFGLSFVRGGGVERVLANPMLLCETDWNSFFKAMHPLQGHLRLAYDELKNHPSSHAVKGNALISKFVAAEPARSQLTCGSCWAQAAIGSFEVALQKAGKFTGPLSVQQILDCVRTSNSNGCSGGVPQDAMEWLQTHPAALEKDYPYTGVQGNCRAVSTGPKTAGWSFAQCRQETIFTKLTGGLIGANSYYVACEDPTNCPDQFKYESPLLIAVKNDGPFIAYVDASQWQHYAGGIYPPDKCSSTMVAGNHVVQLVGYGNDNGTPFWVIKNSWGENWGEGGFIRLPMGVNACGIANFCGQATTA